MRSGQYLVFDEISSGWRMTVGGAHTLFGVTPDIVVYAKAMSNGYPMAAIVGKEEIMDVAQSSFISSTYLDRPYRSCGFHVYHSKTEKIQHPRQVAQKRQDDQCWLGKNFKRT